MADYWVSKKKYFCQYCDIFIADDAPSRSHHENGMRHKGNKERFVKGLYKVGAQRKKDQEDEAREMKHVEAAAARAYALDVGAGRGGVGGSTLPVPKATASAPKKPSNPYANYTTAESLGYSDPDAERIKAEIERKQTQGVAGDWEILPVAPPPVASTSALDTPVDAKPDIDDKSTAVAGVKREAEVPVEDDDDSRAWKLRKKTARLGDIYDPGDIPIKLKPKKREEAPIFTNGVVPMDLNIASGPSAATDVPKWTKLEWRKVGDAPSAATSTEATPVLDPIPPAQSETNPEPFLSEAVKSEPAPVKLEDAPPPSDAGGGGLFKKRKVRGGATVARGRRDQF